MSAQGTAYCWGWNLFQQLGTGTSETCLPDGAASVSCSRTPVPVSGDVQFASISTGFWQGCGITPGGETLCWGNNSGDGELGDGTTTDRATPVPVALPSTALTVAPQP